MHTKGSVRYFVFNRDWLLCNIVKDIPVEARNDSTTRNSLRFQIKHYKYSPQYYLCDPIHPCQVGICNKIFSTNTSTHAIIRLVDYDLYAPIKLSNLLLIVQDHTFVMGVSVDKLEVEFYKQGNGVLARFLANSP